MAEEKKELLDPIAYRSDYNPENIREEYRDDPNLPGVGPLNANVNYQEYGDDSNPAWQSQLGGLNPKYDGEGVLNTEIEYNPNIKTGDLDPNYKYGEEARQKNAQESGYIARRNDNIASALYNEGKVTKEDIAYYLASQPDWNNSTEMDRANTIESIWKRIGQMPKKEEEDKEEVKIGTDTSGKIYGKNTADTGNPEQGINTKADANSAFKLMDEARQANLNTLLRTPPMSIAASLEAGSIPNDMQAIIDLKSFYPDVWADVEDYRKQLRGQDVINAITTGGDMPTNTNTVSNANNSIAVSAANMANESGVSESMADILTDIHQTLQSNATAQGANNSMAEIEEEIAVLNNRLKNLNKRANNIFKGDTPDYLVNAWINNQRQEIQDKLQVLSERYKYASNRYDKEVANAQWEKEYSLKEKQVKVQEPQDALNRWKENNGITSNITNNYTTNAGDPYQVSTLSDEEVGQAVDNLLTMFDNGQLGNAQCGVGLQTYYFPMIGVSISGISSLENKKKLINTDSSYMPKKGDLIIIDSGATLSDGTPAGHIGVVIGVSNGTIQYLDWNGKLGADGKGTEKAAISAVSMDSAKILGFRNVNKTTTSEGGSQNYDVSIYGVGYDPELGFNPNMNNVYEKILNTDWTGNYPENQAEIAGISVKELGRQANNYADAKKNGYVAYTYPDRDTTNFGYVEGKEQIYENIARILGNGKQVAGTQQNTYIKQLGLDPKDPNAWDTVVKEVEAYNKGNNQKFDEVKDLIQATEYIISQDASWIQRVNASTKIGMYGEGSSWRTAYKFIKANEALNALADSKGKGATLTPMSDKDFESIKEASMLLNYSDDDANFKRNVENYYNTLRKTAGLNELTQKELDEMWNTESDSKAKWTNYLVLDSASDYDGKYRYHNGKKAYEKTNKSGYDMEAPLFKGNTSSSNSSDADSEIDDVFAGIGNS